MKGKRITAQREPGKTVGDPAVLAEISRQTIEQLGTAFKVPAHIRGEMRKHPEVDWDKVVCDALVNACQWINFGGGPVPKCRPTLVRKRRWLR